MVCVMEPPDQILQAHVIHMTIMKDYVSLMVVSSDEGTILVFLMLGAAMALIRIQF